MEKQIKYILEEFTQNIFLGEKRKAQILEKLCLYYNKNITNDIKIELEKLNAYILNYEIIENLTKIMSCQIDWDPLELLDDDDLKKVQIKIAPTFNFTINNTPEILQEIELIRKSNVDLKIDFHKLSSYIINQAKENGDLN